MFRISSLTLLFVCFFAFSAHCEDTSALAKEVMDIHDEAMAKMTHMHELKLKLKELVKKNGKTAQTTEAIENLTSSHKLMMHWMREYKPPQKDTDFKIAQSYLLKEKVKIGEVSKAINSSIAEAERLLK